MSIRWDRLFTDLEGQLEAAEQAEFAAEVADRTRHEVAQTTLLDRLRANLGGQLDLSIAGVGAVAGTLRRTGADFIVVETAGSLALVRSAAVAAARDLGGASQPVTDGVAARISFGLVARELARDRSPVTVGLQDGTTLAGTVDRVGADYLDLAEHALDEPRRTGMVKQVRTISIAAIAMVRSPA